MSSGKYEWIIGESLPVLESHSAAKHEVLRSYIARYIEVLTSNPRRDVLGLTLVDGFAGGGAYVFQGREVSGSPLILLQEVACARARLEIGRRKQFRLNAEFIFVERNANNKKFLERTIRGSEYASLLGHSVHILNEEFEQALPNILQAIRTKSRAHRSIFFLDQYGYGQVSLNSIRTILSSLENPEIIVTFNVDSLIDYLSDKDEFLKAVKPVELEMCAIKQMLSMKQQRESRWLIQNLLFQHIRDKTAAPYYTCFFIKCPVSHRAYWLVHISKHPKARDEMALRHWEMSNHFVHHGRPGLKMLGFDPDQNIQQIPMDFLFDESAENRSRNALMTELPPIIFEPSGATDYPQTLGTLFSRVCNETPATTKQIGNVLVSLRDAKEIEIVTNEGRPKPRSTQVNWSDIILPARQRLLFTKMGA